MKEEPVARRPGAASPDEKPVERSGRESDAIYQQDQIVARVIDPQVDTQTKEVRFAEVYNSDNLLLPDECEYQNFKIMIQRIGYATKVEASALHKGRILRTVVADILGYREQ